MLNSLKTLLEEDITRSTTLAYNLLNMLAEQSETSEELQNYLNGFDALKATCKALPEKSVNTNHLGFDSGSRYVVTLKGKDLIATKPEQVNLKNTII